MKKTVADTIQNKIKKGELKMRSPFSVWIEKLSLDSSVIMIIISLIFVSGLAFYWTNNNNDLLFSGYGKYGALSFIQSFPYFLLILFVLLFVFLTFLFRKFDISYKKPFIAIFSIIFSFILLFGWISTQYPLGQRLYRNNEKRLHLGMNNSKNAILGTVIQIQKNLLMIKTADSKQIKIIIDANTHFSYGTPKIGSYIRSVGNWENDSFKAIGIRVFADIDQGYTPGQGQRKRMIRN